MGARWLSLALVLGSGCIWLTGGYSVQRSYVVAGRAEVIHVGREPIVTVRRDGGDVAVHVELADSCRAAARGQIRADEEARRTWYVVPACIVVVPLLSPLVLGGVDPFEFCSYETHPTRTRTLARNGVLWTEEAHRPCREGVHEPAAGALVELKLQSPGPEQVRWRGTTGADGDVIFAGRAAEAARVADFCTPISVVAHIPGDVDAAAEQTAGNQPDQPLSGTWPVTAQALTVEASGGPKDWRALEADSLRVVNACDRDVAVEACEARFDDARAAWTRAGGTEACARCLVSCASSENACVTKCREDHPVRPEADLDALIQRRCIEDCARRSTCSSCSCAAGPPPDHRCPQP